MFSLIKGLQNLLSELKKKKALWFTILTVLSVSGISLSMYLLTTMTTSIAKEVYLNMSHTYKKNLEYKIEDKQKDFKKIILGLQANEAFNNNLNNKPVVDSILELYNKSLIEHGYGEISLVFYSTISQINQYRNSINTVINRKIPSFGVEILPEGPSIIYLHPVVSGDDVLGVIEIKENILSLKKDFERSKQSIFIFLIQEKMMNNLAIDVKNGRYRTVVDDLRVEEQKYDGGFFSNISEDGVEGFKELKENGYVVNKEYFKTYKEVVDINGVTVGYIIIGEKAQGSNGFVNIVDNMTKSVTIIALGLVISILLFMF